MYIALLNWTNIFECKPRIMWPEKLNRSRHQLCVCRSMWKWSANNEKRIRIVEQQQQQQRKLYKKRRCFWPTIDEPINLIVNGNRFEFIVNRKELIRRLFRLHFQLSFLHTLKLSLRNMKVNEMLVREVNSKGILVLFGCSILVSSRFYFFLVHFIATITKRYRVKAWILYRQSEWNWMFYSFSFRGNRFDSQCVELELKENGRERKRERDKESERDCFGINLCIYIITDVLYMSFAYCADGITMLFFFFSFFFDYSDWICVWLRSS